MGFIERKLAQVAIDLADVRDFMHMELQRCSECGAYHSADVQERKDAEMLTEVVNVVVDMAERRKNL